MSGLSTFDQWQFSISGETENSIFPRDVDRPSIFLAPHLLSPLVSPFCASVQISLNTLCTGFTPKKKIEGCEQVTLVGLIRLVLSSCDFALLPQRSTTVHYDWHPPCGLVLCFGEHCIPDCFNPGRNHVIWSCCSGRITGIFIQNSKSQNNAFGLLIMWLLQICFYVGWVKWSQSDKSVDLLV